MTNEITLASALSIRDAGLDEYWLQDQIYENPSCLGLGDLDSLSKERRQSSGGRLDLLLKNPEDDSMYEVEVMLGETDETHIIRTIEYWELDTYEEIDDGESIDEPSYNREFWVKKAKWTVETADTLYELTKAHLPEPVLSYVKHYIAINVGRNNYLWLHKRSGNKSLLGFRISASLADDVAQLLDGANIAYVRKPKYFYLTVDKAFLERNSEILKSIANLVSVSWAKLV